MDLNKDTCQGKTRTIFASVNYLSSALVKENLLYFSFTLPRRTCQGKTCQEELASVYSRQVFLASVNEANRGKFLLCFRRDENG